MLMLARCLITVGLFVAVSANATALNINGTFIQFPVPTGYCEVGAHPADQGIVDYNNRTIGDKLKLLMIFADCKELNDLRSGKRDSLDNYGRLVVQIRNGSPMIFKGVSRSLYIEKMSSVGMADPTVIKRKLKEIEAATSITSTAEQLGVIDKDVNGAYYAFTATYQTPSNRTFKTLGVSGFTLIKEMSFNLHLYQTFKKQTTLDELLSKQKKATANFASAN